MFLLCASGYFTRSCFAFFQPVRQLPRGTLWRTTPCPRSHWGGTNVGLSPGAWAQAPSNGQRVGAGACRRPSQAAGPCVGLQLTSNFTFHRQKPHFSWFIIEPVFLKRYILIKEWIKPLNSGSLTPPSYSCWTVTLLIVFCLVAHRSSCWCLPCLGTYFGKAYFDYCRCSYLLFSD